jgi:AcrR family transcriptional regulator
MINKLEIKEERRKQILFSAKRVFSTKGFYESSVSDIIKEAGIARGTFYLYFTGKRDVFDVLLEDLLIRLDEIIKPIEVAPGKPEPIEQLKTTIKQVLELIVEEPELTRILFRHASGLDQRSVETINDFYERAISMIERFLKFGIQMELIRPCNIRIVACCILGTLKEIANQLSSNKRISLNDKLIEEIISFGLQGISSGF